MIPKRLLYILLLFAISKNVTAQVVDDSTLCEAAANVIEVYYQSLGEESPLYNGCEYLEYAFTIQGGHPFFVANGYSNGSIYFDGMIFHDVPLLYDIVKDQVVTPDFQKIHKINLPADKIQQFTLSGHTFIRLVQAPSSQLRTGFYDRLYEGKIGLFAKREKRIIERNSSLQIYNEVISQNSYYIKKGDTYFTIKNKRGLLDVLKGKRKEIQQYFKKNKIKYKNDPERAMINAVQYYDQLTN